MAKDQFLTVEGIPEINRVIENFAKKEAAKIIRRAAREELKPLAQAVRDAFPKDRGVTAKEIKVRAGKGRRGTINLDVKSKDDNYIPKFIEYGTTDANGNQHIKPNPVFRRNYEQPGNRIRDRIIQRVITESEQKLNSGGK